MAQKRMTQARWNAMFTALSVGIDEMESVVYDDAERETEWQHAREAFIILWNKYGKKGNNND